MAHHQAECATKRHVHFGDAEVHPIQKSPKMDKPMLWYKPEELHNLLEQDLTKMQGNQPMNDSFTERGLEEARGLNLLVDESNKPIKSYMRDVLGIYQYGKQEYGNTDPDVLRTFAVSRSAMDRERAHDLGKQDEQEAYKSYTI